MDGQRSIIFHNDSGRSGDYGLFMAFPHIYCEDNGAMHTAAWITRYVPNRAHEQIDIDEDIYAWHTTQQGSFEAGAILEDGTSHAATLGTKKTHGSSFSTARHPTHNTNTLLPSPTNAAPHDQFEVHAQANPQHGSQELIGIGKRGDQGSIIPIIALQATPSFSYGIAPQARFFLARFDDGNIQPGQVVDLRSQWRKAEIDFSSSAARGRGQAIVTATATGRFEVSYRALSTIGSGGLATRRAGMSMMGSGRRLSITPSVGALARGGQDRWSGKITWPDSATTSAVVQGSGLVIDALGGKYRWSVNTSQMENGGVSMKVYFWLGEGRQPDYLYEEDWNAAVKGLQGQADGALMDMGCFPNTPYGSSARLPLVSR